MGGHVIDVSFYNQPRVLDLVYMRIFTSHIVLCTSPLTLPISRIISLPRRFLFQVYGIALYISKRDALADPAFREYASLSTHELRTRPDFYSLLRTEGQFDRTLLLKLNMQLSTETMRSSLQADWSLLSDERKNLLIHTSTRMRPAETKMLHTIASPANSGRCSCGQVAPDEYHADPSCCARGTELVFTWRKNGNLEVGIVGWNIYIYILNVI